MSNALDAELLAMAGESSEDEEEVEVSDRVEMRTPSPDQVKPSVEKVEEVSSSKRGVAQRVRAKRGRKARRRDDSEDHDDDGDDLIASSPASDSSEDMARSASAADAAGSPDSTHIDDGPMFPLEGKFRDSVDREWLLSLPELEREQELDNRAQQDIRRQQDLQLKRARANNKSTTISKRKAADADLDDGSRKSTRPKMERGAKSALDKYKKAREQAGAERGKRDGRQATKRDQRSPTEDSERDAEGESEVEWADTKSSRRQEPVAELPDYNRCRVGRTNFAKVCFYPGFEEAITGCFTRVSVGPDGYRMALIKGFRDGKPYTLEGQNGKKILTDQYAVVAQGRSEKPWPFAACSDSRFTPTELERYTTLMSDQNLRLPTAKALNAKVEDINKLLNRTWTNEDISQKVDKQKAIEQKYDPANAAKLAREKILQRKAQAVEQDDEEELARCNSELQALDFSSTTRHSPAKPLGGQAVMSEQDRLAQRNAMTRKINSAEVRKALLEERKKDLAAREKAAREAKAKAEAASKRLQVPGSDMRDLFGDGSDVSRSGTPVAGLKKSQSNRDRSMTPSQKASKPLGALRSSQKNDDDVIAALDLGIDIEI